MHHMQVDVTGIRMKKCCWHGPDNAKPKLLPKTDRSKIGRNDGVELHRSIALLASPSQRKLRKAAANTTTSS